MKQFLKDAKGHLMTGIGYMLPLIIGASLVVAIPKLIALCFWYHFIRSICRWNRNLAYHEAD
ncbi:MAG: hypothetical protein ACLS54_08850 [Anaerostipes hadrus]